MAEPVTMKQFIELQEEVREGFASMDKKQNESDHKLDLLMGQMKEQNDARYLQVKDNMTQAMLRLQDPVFRSQCAQIGNDWALSEEGRRHIRDVLVDCVNAGRDQAKKWIDFIKLVGGLVIAAGIIYVGFTMIESQKAIQLLIESIK